MNTCIYHKTLCKRTDQPPYVLQTRCNGKYHNLCNVYVEITDRIMEFHEKGHSIDEIVIEEEWMW